MIGLSAGSVLRVPSSVEATVAWRVRVLERAERDPLFRRAVRQACAEDVVVFVSLCGWLIEPRKVAKRLIPFVPFAYQVGALRELVACILGEGEAGQQDVVVEKSRATGATWMCIYVVAWFWLFHPHAVIGLVSRNEEAVDKADDPDALMNKLDFLVEHLPRWLVGDEGVDWSRNRTSHSLVNRRNGSTVHGYAATGNVASGGRKLFMLMDEFHKFRAGDDKLALSSVQHVTNCRVIVSTYDPDKGRSGAFWEIVNDPNTNARKIVLDWKDDPHKSAGLYTSVDGKLQVLDAGYAYPDGYQFILDGKTRSPYYDWEWRRPGAKPWLIAAELDRNPLGAQETVFTQQFCEMLLRDYVRPPNETGRLIWDPEDLEPEWQKEPNGKLWLWVPLQYRPLERRDVARPPLGRYIVGCDVAFGTGGDFSSNSVAQVFNADTGEQAAEFGTHDMHPNQFAELSIALCHWFHGAFLIWEANGPAGEIFTSAVLEWRYPNVYIRHTELQNTRKKTKKPGYWTSPKGPTIQFGRMQRLLNDGQITVRSERLVKEMPEWVFRKGHLVHNRSVNVESEASAGLSHGDYVTAAAVMVMGLEEIPSRKAEAVVDEAPWGSFLWRRQEAQRRQEQRERKALWSLGRSR